MFYTYIYIQQDISYVVLYPVKGFDPELKHMLESANREIKIVIINAF